MIVKQNRGSSRIEGQVELMVKLTDAVVYADDGGDVVDIVFGKANVVVHHNRRSILSPEEHDIISGVAVCQSNTHCADVDV